MASLLCAHCTRPMFLRPQQLPPASALCVPCGQRQAEQRSTDRAWRAFMGRLLEPAVTPQPHPKLQPLRPLVDLRHL
jgi:hypothetical protein